MTNTNNSPQGFSAKSEDHSHCLGVHAELNMTQRQVSRWETKKIFNKMKWLIGIIPANDIQPYQTITADELHVGNDFSPITYKGSYRNCDRNIVFGGILVDDRNRIDPITIE
jgi:hypothetical protein